MKQRTIKLAIPAGEPPTEICLFKRGENETTKGTFLFDDEAAASVMAEYRAHGIDLCFDYGHSMVDGTGLDPAEAGRAAGWFNLEVRDGALWAVNIRWTDPAAEAIRRKEWRFFSPAFNADKDGRVRSLLNVAVTNLPATRKLQPLVAASKGTNMTPEEKTDRLAKLLDVLGLDPSATTQDILAKVEELTGSATPKKPENPAPDSPPPADVAASQRIMSLTSTTSLASAAAQVQVLQRELQAITAERDEHANAERVRLCTKLVTHAGKAPAAVWADPFVKGAPKPYLNRMSLAELKEHVETECANVPPEKRPKTIYPSNLVQPPVKLDATSTPDGGKVVQASYGPVTLAAREVRMFDSTPEGEARMKAYVETAFVRRRHEERQAENGGAQ